MKVFNFILLSMDKITNYLVKNSESKKIFKYFFMVILAIYAILAFPIGLIFLLTGFWECEECNKYFWKNQKNKKIIKLTYAGSAKVEVNVCNSCLMLSALEVQN